MRRSRRSPVGHWTALLLMPCLLLSQAAARGHQFEACDQHENEARPHLHWNLDCKEHCDHQDDAASCLDAASPADHHDDAVYLSADSFSFDRASNTIEAGGEFHRTIGIDVTAFDFADEPLATSFQSTMLTASPEHCARYLAFQRILI